MQKVLVRALGAAAAGAAALAGGTAQAEEAATLVDAITEGKPIFEMRPRYETLDQQGQNEADALTLRTRLGWKTASWNGLSALIEIEDVRDLGGDYNDGIPPAEPFASIPDPEGTEVNRLQLSWRANAHFTGTLGRQTIEYDDKRFIDGSNSRQDARTYDAVRGDVTFGGTRASYSYLDQVNNTTHDYNDLDTESHLLNVSHGFSDALRLTGFVYALDFDTPTALNQSSRYIGGRVSGEVEAIGGNWEYVGSYANQTDYGHSALNFDLDYWHAAVTATYGEFSTRIWYESLEGNGALGLFFPIGSSNNFQGWAGAFSTKPADGVNDFNIGVTYAPEWAPDFLEDLEFMARWYDFEAERTGVDFGNEIDLSISSDLTERLSWSVEYGDYNQCDAGSPAARTRMRLMLQFKL